MTSAIVFPNTTGCMNSVIVFAYRTAVVDPLRALEADSDATTRQP